MSQTASSIHTPATAPAFDWQDPLRLDDELTEEERLVRDTAREYSQNKLMPRILEANRLERFDPKIMTEMGELGLLGATIDGYRLTGIQAFSA